MIILILFSLSGLCQGKTWQLANINDVTSRVPAATLAKFDMHDQSRGAYAGYSQWATVRSLNPATLIFIYQLGMEMPINQDSSTPINRNGIGGYATMAASYFLLNSSGGKVFDSDYPSDVLMDFGSAGYQAAWIAGTTADIVNQPWKQDGIFADRCDATETITRQVKYTSATWPAAMTGFIAAITKGMGPQRIWANTGQTAVSGGPAAWLATDTSANPPDAVLEEGAWAIKWGAPSPGVWFYTESVWKQQVDLMGQIHHSKTVWESHANLTQTGPSGKDQNGNPVGFWDAFWYSMCSYLMGKNAVDNNSYFVYEEVPGQVIWYPEWSLDIGDPTGPYAMATIGSAHVYSRPFTKGMVYVNPTTATATVPLTAPGSVVNHTNFTNPPAAVSSFSLPANRAVIVLPGTTLPPPPPVPTISGLAFAPASIASGTTLTGTGTLTAPASTGGSMVGLMSNNAALTVPPSVTVSAGSTSATFTATTGTVTANQTAIMTATLNGSAMVTATVTPPPCPGCPTCPGCASCCPACPTCPPMVIDRLPAFWAAWDAAMKALANQYGLIQGSWRCFERRSFVDCFFKVHRDVFRTHTAEPDFVPYSCQGSDRTTPYAKGRYGSQTAMANGLDSYAEYSSYRQQTRPAGQCADDSGSLRNNSGNSW